MFVGAFAGGRAAAVAGKSPVGDTVVMPDVQLESNKLRMKSVTRRAAKSLFFLFIFSFPGKMPPPGLRQDPPSLLLIGRWVFKIQALTNENGRQYSPQTLELAHLTRPTRTLNRQKKDVRNRAHPFGFLYAKAVSGYRQRPSSSSGSDGIT